MRISLRGHITIPAKIRRQAQLSPGTEVEIVFDGEAVRITRKNPKKKMSGQQLVEHMTGRLSKRGLTTDQIMAMTRR